MPAFKISCTWEVYGTAYVEADTLEKAVEKANDPCFPLPTDTNYVDGSFSVDPEMSAVLSGLEDVENVI